MLFVCVNRRPDGTPKGSCAARGAVEVHTKLKAMLKDCGLGGTEVRACTSSCLDTCWVGPAIAVEPDDFFYGRVQLSDVEEIVDALERGERVERLVLSSSDFGGARRASSARVTLDSTLVGAYRAEARTLDFLGWRWRFASIFGHSQPGCRASMRACTRRSSLRQRRPREKCGSRALASTMCSPLSRTTVGGLPCIVRTISPA